MREEERAEVLIAGGGPVGMGLAIELGQRGIKTTVVERYPSPQLVPKGQNLTQRTMEHFHFWHAEGALRTARTIPLGNEKGGLTTYGTLLGGYHYNWLQRELVRPYYFTDNERLPQYATEQVLRDRVAEIDCVTVHYGWAVEEAQQTGDGVRLSIKHQESGDSKTLSGDFLVGCDGSRSTIRSEAGITQTLSDHDKLMVLLVFRSRELSRLLADYADKSFYNVLHPALKGYWMFFGRVGMEDDWFFHAPVPQEAATGDFDFAAYLHQAVGTPFDVTFEHVGFWDLRFALADNYRKGRILIAGDAAHSHPPYGGYGINTGFEDARNLGWKLAATLRGWAGTDLLDSYHEERHGVFASTAKDFIEKAINADRDFLEAFDPERDLAAFETEWAARSGLAREEVHAFEPNYHGSSIVWGEPGAGCNALGEHSFQAIAGRHLTPQPLSSGHNIYDALGADFTLVALDADPAAVAALEQAAAALGMPLTVVRDSAAGGRERYDARLILVRPDQFVAWAADTLSTPAGEILERAIGVLGTGSTSVRDHAQVAC